MDKKEVVKLWLERVEYDLSAAQSMFKSGHLLYVAFLCQQGSEKVLKALWCMQKEESPPYTHNLSVLAESLTLSLSEDQQNFLELLNRFYIVGRYPAFKQKLSSSLNKESAGDLLGKTEGFVAWCRKFIKM